MIFNSGTRAWYSDLEWIAGYPTRNQVGQQKHMCYILESTHAYTIVHIFPTLLESILASKCGRMAVYKSISGHIHTYITHELGPEALNRLAHAGLSMSESQVHKYTPESAYIVNTSALGCWRRKLSQLNPQSILFRDSHDIHALH